MRRLLNQKILMIFSIVLGAPDSCVSPLHTSMDGASPLRIWWPIRTQEPIDWATLEGSYFTSASVAPKSNQLKRSNMLTNRPHGPPKYQLGRRTVESQCQHLSCWSEPARRVISAAAFGNYSGDQDHGPIVVNLLHV